MTGIIITSILIFIFVALCFFAGCYKPIAYTEAGVMIFTISIVLAISSTVGLSSCIINYFTNIEYTEQSLYDLKNELDNTRESCKRVPLNKQVTCYVKISNLVADSIVLEDRLSKQLETELTKVKEKLEKIKE